MRYEQATPKHFIATAASTIQRAHQGRTSREHTSKDAGTWPKRTAEHCKRCEPKAEKQPEKTISKEPSK
eukprot:3407119-Amphidinium_carterae.1